MKTVRDVMEKVESICRLRDDVQKIGDTLDNPRQQDIIDEAAKYLWEFTDLLMDMKLEVKK